jgi:hypothetical protein
MSIEPVAPPMPRSPEPTRPITRPVERLTAPPPIDRLSSGVKVTISAEAKAKRFNV